MKDKEALVQDFHQVVNMGEDELRSWLDTNESSSVGMTLPGEDESQGHKSGRQILDILAHERERGRGQLPPDEYSSAELQEMARVVSYVRRHLSQWHRLSAKTPEEVERTRWAKSLRNWAHDPLKDDLGLDEEGGGEEGGEERGQ